MDIPKKIHITSDNSCMELVRTEKDKKSGEEVYVYRFIKSREKLGLEFKLTKRELVKQMHSFFEEIE